MRLTALTMVMTHMNYTVQHARRARRRHPARVLGRTSLGPCLGSRLKTQDQEQVSRYLTKFRKLLLGM